MEAAVSFKEVAIPDAIASGMPGTGHEYLSAAGTIEVCTREPGKRSGPVSREGRAPETREDPTLWYGDPAFPLTGGLERISVRLDKKIDRQGRRFMRINERGRS